MDSTAFYSGIFQIDGSALYSTPKVLDEIKKISRTMSHFENALELAEIKTIEPSIESVKRTIMEAKRIGEEVSVSPADTEVVAATLDLKKEGFEATVASDDFAVENLSRRLGIEFKAISTKGIRYVVNRIIYCPGCSLVFKKRPSDMLCTVCGTKLRRKIRQKQAIV